MSTSQHPNPTDTATKPTMQTEWVRLNLVFPPALEDAITDTLIADPSLPGFTLLQAEGHSSDFANATIREQVRGRVDKRLLWIVTERQRVDDLLASLRQRISSRDVRWWLEPVLAGGRLV